jgi:predicted phosphodiesterase
MFQLNPRSSVRTLFLFLSILLMIVVAHPVFGSEPTSQPTQPMRFSFIVCSDPHLSDNQKGQPTGVEKFGMLLKQIQSQKHQPDFIFITGDIHVPAFQQMMTQLKPTIPIHVTPGNHEKQADRETLDRIFPNDFKGRDFYAFEHKGCTFIAMCDASANGDHVGHLESEGLRGEGQTDWLKSQLAQAHGSTFLFAHIPMNPQGKADGKMFLATNDQKYLKELIHAYKPAGVFFGHLHQRKEFKIDQTPVFVSPSVNWNFAGESAGYFEVSVYPDHTQTRFVPLEKK